MIKEYFLPRSLEEALDLLSQQGPSLHVMAGGTILMPLINDGISTPEKVMGLRQAGLDYVRRDNGEFAIGAMTTLSRMMAFEEIPLCQQAAHSVGGWSIRNMGTVGGNLFAPPPAGDFAVALLALDAQVKLAGGGGERVLPLSEFYTGFMDNVLRQDELVVEFRVPAPEGRTAYIKYGRKAANTAAVVTVAARLVLDDVRVTDARLALNAVGPHPIRATEAEAALVGSTLNDDTIATAAAAAAEECEPFTDAVASEWYRRRMVDVYVRRTLAQIAG